MWRDSGCNVERFRYNVERFRYNVERFRYVMWRDSGIPFGPLMWRDSGIKERVFTLLIIRVL